MHRKLKMQKKRIRTKILLRSKNTVENFTFRRTLKMGFDYVEEKQKLKKKLTMLLIIFVVLMVIFNTVLKADTFLWSIIMSLVCALMLYIPGRIKERFNKGWIFTIIITIVYMWAFALLFNAIGNFAGILVLLPLADIGYSIYKISSNKNNV